MLLCMFHPDDRPMERGWVGRIDGERVVHLAAQTLQHYFTGGGGAREHAEYARSNVTLLAPVLHPPTVRLFEDEHTFAFANATAVLGPDAAVPRVGARLSVHARLAAVVGADGVVGGYSALAEWRSDAASAKANDFGLVLGPVVATDLSADGAAFALRADGTAVSEGVAGGFHWAEALAVAARGTRLRTGDVVAGPVVCSLERIPEGDVLIEAAGIGVLRSHVAAA